MTALGVFDLFIGAVNIAIYAFDSSPALGVWHLVVGVLVTGLGAAAIGANA